MMKSDRPRPSSQRRSSEVRPQRSGTGTFKKGGARDRKFDPNRRKEQRASDRPIRKVRIEPVIPDDVEAKALPGKIRAELLSLSAENAEVVARQMVMIDRLLASGIHDDLRLAHQFGKAAVDRAGRVGVVRHYAGRAALSLGEFGEAKKDFSAASRILGLPILKVYLAECEVGLGKARKALEILGEVKVDALSSREVLYARLISAEAREALGQRDAAWVTLSVRGDEALATLPPEDHILVERWRSLKERLAAARSE